MHRCVISALMMILVMFWQIGQPLHAATFYWDVTGSSTWVTGANWSDNAVSGGTTGVVPGASDIAVFNQSSVNGATTATIAAATSIGGFVFNNTGTTGIRTDATANRTFTIGTGGITINAGAGAVTFGTTTNLNRIPITLGGSQTWLNNSSNTFSLNANNTINTAGHTLTVDGTGNTTAGGVISGAGGLIKNGTGTLTLGNVVNTYTGGAILNNGVLIINGANTMNAGGITVNGGILRLGNNAALGGGANTLTINGGSIDVTAARTTTNNNAQNWNGDFTFLGTNTWDTGTGNVVMNASRSVTVSASTLTVGGSISGIDFGLTKLGAGTLVLAGGNTYSGATNVNTGTLSLTGSLSGGAAITVNGSAIFSQDAASVISGASSFTHSSTGTSILAGANTFSGGIIITAGTVNLTNSNGYSGATSINRGTLNLSGGGSILSTSALSIGQRGTLTLDNVVTNLIDRVADMAAITSGGGTINFIGNSATTTETLGALTLNAGALTINSTAGAGGSALRIASISARAVGGTLNLNNNAGASVILSTAPALTNGILNYAVVNDTTLASFASYSTSGGTDQTVVPLALVSHNQGAESTWAAGNNVRPTSDVVLTAARTVYTLTLDNTIDWNISSADRTLNLSGGVLQTGGTSVIGTAGGTIDNILAWGANEAIFHILGTLQLNRGNTNTLTGTAGLTKSGAGTLILNGVSTLTVATVGSAININEGTLELRGATALLPASSIAPVNMNGAMLRLSNDANTTYNAPLVINANTIIEISRVTAAATATTHTVGTLTIGGGTTLFVTPNTTQISGGATAYGLSTNALTLTSDGAVFDVSNNGTGTGTLTVGTISGAFTFVKAGAGDFVTNSTVSGYTTAINIGSGRIGWANASGTITENQVFSGTGGIIKSAAGTVNLTSMNTFIGGVTTAGGTLQFSTVSNNGGPASNLGQGTDGFNLSGGTLSFIGGTSQSTDRGGAVNASTSLSADGTGGATITYSGTFTAPGANVSTTLTGDGDGFITGSFNASSGTGDIIKSGAGTWTISGTTTTGDDILVNAGRLVLTGAAKTVTDDIVVTGATSILDLNATNMLNGAGTSSGLYARAGATINLNANDPYGSTLDFILLGDNSTGGGTLNTNVYTITTPRIDLGQDSAGFTASITGSGSVTAGASFRFYQGEVTSNVSLLGAGSFYKLGAGTVTLSGVMSGLSGAIAPEIHSGTLVLDYSTNNARKFVATDSLNMSGGALTLNGNATVDTFETVAGLVLSAGTNGAFATLTGGTSVITLNPGGSQKVVLSIGDIIRSVGGTTIRFNLSSGVQDATNGILTTQANTNGIIGGFAMVNDGGVTSFATNSGGNIVAVTPTFQDDVTLWATAQNISDLTGFTGTLTSNTSITSLRFNANAASTVTIASGVVLNVSSGGILQTINVGGISTIAGGRLQSGAGSELIFNVNSTSQLLDVTSQIAGNASVTKGGSGTLFLNSANNFYTGTTSVLGGTLQVSGGNAIGDRSSLVVGGGQTSTLELLADETVGSLSAGGENGSTAGVGVVSSININGNKLTFNQDVAATMAGTLITSTSAGILVKSGSANWTNAASNPGFLGTFQVDQGLAIFNGNVNNLSAANAIILNGSGSSLRLDNDQSTAVGSRITDTATVTLNNTAGVTADALGLYMRRTAGTTTGTETLGQLILNAGHNTIAADGTGTNRIGTINFTNATPLVRHNFATLFVVGRSLGDTAATQRGNVNFATNPGGSIGGGGAAGTTTINIFPYVIGESTAGAPNGSVNFGNSFVRYGGTGAPSGFKPLTTAEYINDSAAPATGANNVRYTASNAITTPTAINSLLFDSGTAIALTGSATSMEITSGAILAAGAAAHSIGTISGLTTGSSGANPYYVYVTNPLGQLTLDTPLTSVIQMVKSGAGSLILTSSGNMFTDLYFNQGIVSADALNKLGSGNLMFFGGTLQFAGVFDPSSTKTITLGTGGGTLDTNGHNITLANGVGAASIGLGGAGGLTKIGAGSLTLAAQAAYAGVTVIENGTLVLASGADNRLPTTTALILGGGTASGVLQLGNGSGASHTTVTELSNAGIGAGNAVVGGDNAVSILTVNQTTQTDFSGSIGGAGSNQNNIGLTKSGVGSLTLSGANLSFVGPLSVIAGDLNITGSTAALLTPSALTVNAGATLNLLNGVGQIIDLGAGALNIGAGTGPAILGFELGSTSLYDHIVTTGSATTHGSVLINLTNLAGFGAGNYDLLKADAGGLSGATYNLGAAALGGVSLNLLSSDTLVQLQVNAIVGDLYWKGAVGSGWTAFNGANSNFTTDLAGTVNALGIPGTNNGVVFSANSQTNTALNTTLNANFFIRDLTFNNNLGSGPLNTISIAEGSGGSLTITPTVPTAGINMQAGAVASVSISAPVVLGASQTWTVADAGSLLTVSGGISGTGNLIKAGGGTLVLSGASVYAGSTTVSSGTLMANSATAFNSTSAFLVGASGTLRLNGFAQTMASLAGTAGSIVENGAASGNVVLTFGDSSSTEFAGTLQNGGAATLGLTKIGAGTLTISGTSSALTGNISVNGGILAVTGAINNGIGAVGTTTVGSTAGTQGILYVSGGGSYSTTSMTVGSNATGVGALVINGGAVTMTTPTATIGISVGTAGYGALEILSGSFTTNRLSLYNSATGTGVAQIFGGTLNVSEYIILSNLRSEFTVAGGTVLHNSASQNIALGYNLSGTSVMNMVGGLVDNTGRNVSFGQAAGTPTAILNLKGGTLLTNAITVANTPTALINFNGGTLKAAIDSAAFVPFNALLTTRVYSGGAIIDTNGRNVTIASNLIAPTGDGVSSIAVSSGGSGYIAAPYVEITDGGGTGATAYAVVDLVPGSPTYGQVTSIHVTNPGVGYSSAPTVTLQGGGATTGATLGAVTTVNNISGGLVKNGLGVLTLTGANTYTGGTTITNGTLALGANDVLADSGNVMVNGGTLDVGTRTDTVATVSLQGGGITGSTGVLTSSADYDLRSGTVGFTGSGGLAGSGTVTKTTAGTVTLLSNGFGTSFLNAVNINGGKLEFSSGSQFGSASGIGIGVSAAAGILSLVTPTTANVTQTVTIGSLGATLNTDFALGTLNLMGGITTSTSGDLTKTGPGTVTVTNTTDLNGGVVTVLGGTLNAGFSASGISGVSVAAGGVLNLFDGSAVTTAITSLNLVNGSALGFDLNAPGTNDVLALTINAPVLAGTITVNLNDIGGLAVGTYDLISSALGGLNGASYLLGAAPSGPNYSFATVSGDTILRLTVSALTLRYWQGDQDGSWSTNNGGNTNWAIDENGVGDVGALPSFSDTLVFSAANAPFTTGSVIDTMLDGSRAVDSLRFIAAPAGVTAFSISPGSGGTLTLTPVSSNNGISVADNAGVVTISAQIATGAAQTWEVIGTGANGSSLTISGDVIFNNSVIKTGTGMLTLSGNNSGAGGLTINAGALNLGSSTAPGSGTLTFGAGITLDNSSGVALTLGNNNALVVNGSFSFTGTHALNLGAGGLTLGINAIVQVVNSTLTAGGIIGDGGNAWSLGKTGSGTLVLNGANTYGGLTNLLEGTLTLAGDNSAAGGGVSTAAATTLNINHNNALGTGTLNIGAGAMIDNTLGSLVTNAGNNLQFWNGGFTFTGTNSLDLGTGAVTLGSAVTVTTGGAATTLTVGGIINDGINTFNLTKDGAGTLVFSGLSANAANNYSGTTILNGGTLAITGAASLAGGLTFGTAGGTNLSTLDLINGSATFGGTTLVQTNSTSANTITIGSGQTLRLNGTVMVGATGNTTTVLNTSGLGTLTIGAAGEATNANVSLGGNVTTNVSNGATWDMSGLSIFYANLGTGTFRIGNLTNSGGSATRASTLTLAVNSTILATTLVVASPDSGVTQALKLGSGTNIINANTINIGGDGASRSSGTLSFNTGTGTLQIRSLSDPVNGRATLNVANVGNVTASSSISSFDVAGHMVDLLLSTMTVASRTGASTGSATGMFSFDNGNLNADNLVVGNKVAGTLGGDATGTVSLGGTGVTTINNTAGPVQLGVNVSSNGTSSGTLNVSGGTVNIAAFAGISIRLGQATVIGGAANGLLDVSGGVVTVAGDIVRGSTAGTSSATITLRGGTLDMSGNTIGSAGAPVTVNAESGTLKNVFQLNSGGTLTKTTSGTLILEGINSYTGTTLISAGVLQVGSGLSTGTLGTGSVTNNATLTFNRDNSYSVGNVISGTGQVIQSGSGTTVLTGANTYNGTTTISAGTLQLGDGTSGRDGTIGNSLSIVNNSALVYNRFGTSSYGGVISGTGAVTKSGSGTQILTGVNTYSGDTVIAQGTLRVGATNALAAGSKVFVGGGATAGVYDIGGFAQATNHIEVGAASTSVAGLGSSIIDSVGGGLLTIDGTLRYKAGTGGFNNGQAIISANLDTGATSTAITVEGSDQTTEELVITGAISGVTVIKNGAGVLKLTNPDNTYTFLQVREGTVQFTNAGALGRNDVQLGDNATDGTLVYLGGADISGRQFRIGSNTGGDTGSGSIINNGTGGLNFTVGIFNQARNADSTRTLTLGGTNTGTDNVIQGVIQDNNGASGRVAITKEGSNTWVLNGNNTYTGDTVVNAGRLDINGINTGTGVLTVAGGASLGGEGSVSGNVTLGSASMAANLFIDGSTSGNFTTSGDLDVSNGVKVFFSVPGAGTGGVVNVITYGGTLTGSTSNFTLDPSIIVSDRIGGVAVFADNAKTITVDLGKKNLTWDNTSANDLWDINTSANWTGGDTKFFQGDVVNFTDTAAGTVKVAANITAATVNFSNTTAAYTLDNNGGGETLNTTGGIFVSSSGADDTVANVTINADITGTGGITKDGRSRLTLTGTNTFEGTITINGTSTGVSRLVISSDANLGHVNNAIVFGGVSNPDLQFTDDMTLAATRVVTTNSTGGGGEFLVNANKTVTFGGVIDGASGFRKNGTGTLNLTGTASTFGLGDSFIIISGTVQVAALANEGFASSIGRGGLIQIGNGGGGNSTLDYLGSGSSTDRQVRIGGGTAANHDANGTILNNGTGALVFTNAAFNTAQGNAIANRKLILGGANTDANEIQGAIIDNDATDAKISLEKQDAGKWILSGASTYSGTTSVSGGTLQLGNGGTTGTLNIASDISVDSGATFAINRSDTVTQGTDFSASAISGAGGFAQVGAGTTVLTAVNTYSGATAVSGGTLQVGDGTSGALAGVGTVTVSGTGTKLSGSGSIAGGTIIGNGAVLAPGVGSTDASNKKLTFTAAGTALVIQNGGQIQLGLTSTTQIDGSFDWTAGDALTYLNNNGGTSGAAYTGIWAQSGDYDSITLTNGSFDFSAGGTIKLLDNSPAYSVGQIFKLLDWSTVGTTPLGGFGLGQLDLSGVNLGSLTFDTSAFTTYGVLVIVPEPSRSLLLMIGLFGLMHRRRRLGRGW